MRELAAIIAADPSLTASDGDLTQALQAIQYLIAEALAGIVFPSAPAYSGTNGDTVVGTVVQPKYGELPVSADIDDADNWRLLSTGAHADNGNVDAGTYYDTTAAAFAAYVASKIVSSGIIYVPTATSVAALTMNTPVSIGNATPTQLDLAGAPSFGTMNDGTFTAGSNGQYIATFGFSAVINTGQVAELLAEAQIYHNGTQVGLGNTDTGFAEAGASTGVAPSTVLALYMAEGETLTFYAYLGNPAGGISLAEVSSAYVTLAKIS